MSGSELLLHLLRVEPEHLRRRRDVALGPQCRVGNGQCVLPLPDVNLDLGVHSRLEEVIGVGNPHQHVEHRDVLLHGRLRLDFQNCSFERPVGIGIDRDAREQTRLHLADVRLVDQRADLHRIEVCHLEQDGPATHVRGRRGDHRAELDVLGNDRPSERRLELRVGHAVARILEIGLRANHRRVGIRIVEFGGVVLGLCDGLRLEQRVRSRELGLRVAELRLSDRQIRLGLREVVARDSRVDRSQQLAGLHVVTGLHVHPDDLARCLGLHVHGQHRLDRSGRRCRHDDVAALDRHRFVRRVGLRLVAGHGGGEQYHHRAAGCVHGWLSVLSSRSIFPSSR